MCFSLLIRFFKSHISHFTFRSCDWLVWCLYRSMKLFPPLVLVYYEFSLYNPMLIRGTSAGLAMVCGDELALSKYGFFE